MYLLKAKSLVHFTNHAQHATDFTFDLFRSAKNMRIILRERAHSGQTSQNARTLEAVQAGKVRIAERQVPVGVLFCRIDIGVPRAIHGLDPKVASLNLGKKDIFLVVLVVAGTVPEINIKDLRGQHFLVAIALVEPPHIGDQLVIDKGPFGVKKRAPRCNGIEAEQIKFPAHATMVTAFGFLKQGEVLAEFLWRCKGRPVDALEHLVFFVPPPICASHTGEFKGRDAAS